MASAKVNPDMLVRMQDSYRSHGISDYEGPEGLETLAYAVGENIRANADILCGYDPSRTMTFHQMFPAERSSVEQPDAMIDWLTSTGSEPGRISARNLSNGILDQVEEAAQQGR